MAENVLFDPSKQATTPPQPVVPPMQSPQPPTNPIISRTKLPSMTINPLIKIGGGILLLLIIVGGIIAIVLSHLQPQTSTKVTLTYWGVWEDQKIMQPIIDNFEKLHPLITIDYQLQDVKQLSTENQSYPTRVIARINSGTGPDLFRYHNTWYPMLSGVLAPFPSDVMTTQVYGNTFFPVVAKDLVHNGAIYGVPLGFDTLSLFVNPAIFQGSTHVPTDWNDFYTTAKNLTVKGPDGTITTAGAAMGTMTNVSHATDIVGLLLADSDVNQTDIAATSDKAGTSLLYYTNFANSTGSVWDPNLPLSLQTFAKGNLAMYIGYSWDIFAIQSLNPTLQFEIHPMPSLYGTKRTVANYWVEGVSLKSKHPQEAMLFMKYLLQKDTEQQFYTSATKVRGFGELFARKDLADTLKNNKLLYPFVQQGPVAVSSVFISDTYDNGINDVSNKFLQNAVAQVASSNTPDAAVSTLSDGLKQVFKQYGQ